MPSSFVTDAIKQQAESLLSRMTLAQKIGQMTQVERSTCSPQEVREYHIGSVLSGAGSYPGNNELADWHAMIDDYWNASVSHVNYGLGIPILYGVDAIHGHGNLKSATIFPHQIGLGAIGSPELIEQISRATAKELLATGVNWVFGPNLAVAKNIHWGRTYESFSSHTEEVSKLARALVTGYQTIEPSRPDAVVACAKHFVGDGGTEHGVDQGDTKLSQSQLMSEHVAPYIEAINANVMSIMVSFSSWNGVKCHANKPLLTDLLKTDLGFDGFVLSDMEGIDYLSSDFYQAVSKGVNAGIDMFMMPNNWSLFMEYMHHHVEFGSISIARIDDAVRRILQVKIAAGLFDAPTPSQNPVVNREVIGCQAHRELARKAVQRSLVTLTNNAQLLPLSPGQSVLVTGKNANNVGHQCGGFTIDWQGFSGNEALLGATSIWQGIQQIVPHARLEPDNTTAAQIAPDFDVAIVVIGETPYAEGLGDIRDLDNTMVNCFSMEEGQFNVLEPYGRSLALSDLHPEDLQTLEMLRATGIEIVTVLISGRPLVVDAELKHSDAFVAAWLPGSEGQGVADVLFGQAPMTGQLKFPWPNLGSS